MQYFQPDKMSSVVRPFRNTVNVCNQAKYMGGLTIVGHLE